MTLEGNDAAYGAVMAYDGPPIVTDPPKRKGRPKGSKNKPKSEVESMYNEAFPPDPTMVEDEVTFPVPGCNADWVYVEPTAQVLLSSEVVEAGLKATVSKHIVVVVSELPNGNASLVTNIGSTQPLILVTAEPYAEVKEKFFPSVKG